MSRTAPTLRPAFALAALALATLAGPGTARAAKANWPSTVSGVWLGNGNNYGDDNVNHRFDFQQANENAQCRKITGKLNVVGQAQADQPLRGFYCPDSGRIVFSREFGGEIVQVWFGHLAKSANGPFMTGSFASVTNVGGIAGEYPFFAIRSDN
jgi:hypothetical protein